MAQMTRIKKMKREVYIVLLVVMVGSVGCERDTENGTSTVDTTESYSGVNGL